jgi:hypothetical protein
VIILIKQFSIMKTTFSKHVAALDQVIGYCNNLGASYSPVTQSMTISALSARLSSARGTLDAYDAARGNYIVAVNKRNTMVRSIPYLATRVYNLVVVSGANQDLLDDIMRLRRKLRSVPGKKKKPVTEAVIVDQSRGPISELDTESKIRNFGLMMELVKAAPDYASIQLEMQRLGLLIFHDELINVQRALHAAKMSLTKAEMDRTEVIH